MKAATYHRRSHDQEEFSDEDIAVIDFVQDRERARVGPFTFDLSRGWDLVQRYVDDASANRPAFARMLDDARRGRFELLVVHRGELLHRSRRELDALVAQLAELGVAVHFLTPLQPVRTEMRGRPPREIDVERARAMNRRGMSHKAIAIALGVGQATVHRAIGRRRTSTPSITERVRRRAPEQLSLL